MKSKTLKDRIAEHFNWTPEQVQALTGRHETDLYVKYSPEVWAWLKDNYEWIANIKPFTSAIDKTVWLDIPFAAWSDKYPEMAV